MTKKFKLKKVFLLFLVPLLMATQFENKDINSGFETTYLLQNNSSIDLILITEEDQQIVIENKAIIPIGSNLNATTDPIIPLDSVIFNSIKLYKKESDNFILVYKQEPIESALWIVNEPSINKYDYTFIITDALIN